MKNITLYIPKIICVLMFVGSTITVHAQNIPNSSSRPAATPNTLPPAYTNTTVNYLRMWEPSMPTADPAVVAASTDISVIKQGTQYFDGLGRPLQTVSKGITPTGKDLVAPIIYNDVDREQYKYLPYVPQTGNTNDGKFKTDPFNGQKNFYQTASLNPGAVGENIYYSQIEYEPSPLNRVSKIYAQGNTWAKNDPTGIEKGGNRPVEQQYLVNSVADDVRMWDVADAGGLPTSASGRIYAAGVLYKNVLKDERGLRMVEFKDKEDRVVLKRVELVSGAADGLAGWLSTYYVYDDLGNLRCVIPPKAVDLIKNTWVIDAATSAELCYFFEYDGRRRLIRKKMPGAAYLETVYDVRDRPVFTQDGNLKAANQWQVIFYDAMNRPVMTALYNSTATRDALQTSMNSAISNTQSISYTIPGVADLLIASYDGMTANYQATNSIVFEDGFDSGTGATILAEINGNENQGTVSVAASNSLPNISADDLTPLTYVFYDNYNFTGAQSPETIDFSKPQAGTNSYPEAITGVSAMTKGLITGTKVKVLGTSDRWLTTTTYYNNKGRVIQTIGDNVSGSKDIVTNLYDFNGKLLSSYLKHRNQRSGTTPQTIVLTMLTYDAVGRVKTIKERINDNAAWERTIVDNTYDELGRLQTKRLGVTSATTQMETLSYEYNIRGWLKSINKGFLSGPTANWFAQDLSYDYGFTANQYNSNIAGAKWKSRGDGINRAYGYAYDNANRLTTADFSQQNSSGASWTKDQKDFTLSGLNYDLNGNISTMTQKGMVGTAIATIDQLAYTYKANSNKLMAVTDPSSTNNAGLGDFINGTNTGDDYAYDANGNLTKDLNKNITSITYNHLNLPEIITVSGKGSVKYQYDAAGNKLKKSVTDNTSASAKTTTTDYIGGFVYQNDEQQLMSHEEGRIRPIIASGQPLNYTFDYFVADYLGNVRVVLTEQTDLGQYVATMETDNAATEKQLFSNIEETRTAKPVGYPQDETSKKNEFVAKLNAKEGGKKIGPSLVLRVMAGDTVQMGARVFYKSAGPKYNRTVKPEDMVISLIQAFGGGEQSAFSHGVGRPAAFTPFSNLTGNDYQRLKEKDPDNPIKDKPKAYLNFVLFDDQFKLVEENSGVRSVKAEPDQLQTLAVEKMPVKKTGFLYVYTSNETEQDVLFDNVTVAAANGPLLEESHYYPFGLVMAGISSQAPGKLENLRKFNKASELQHKEFSDGSGLELYTTNLRTLDPQLGRWWQIDPKPDYTVSPYASMQNNPISYNDPVGDTITGNNRKSAKRERAAIRSTFKGKEGKAMRRLFRLQGKTFAQIDKKKFYKAAGKLSEDQRALAEGYMKLINSTKLHTVEVVNREETLSSGAISVLGITAGSKGEWVDKNAGGGVNTATNTGSYTVIVQNSANGPADYMDQSVGQFVPRNSSAGELSAHELLGHALGRENSSKNYKHLDAIQMTNMYLRATGDGNFYRNGYWHGTQVIISAADAAKSPSYVQDTNNTVKQIFSMLPVLIRAIP